MDTWSWVRLERADLDSSPSDATLVEIRWRVQRASQDVIVCGIYNDTTGLQLRAVFQNGDVVRSRRTPHIEEARLLAGEWLDAILEEGDFEQVSASPET
jgi:hypothetical protein